MLSKGHEDNKISLYFSLSFRGSISHKSSTEEFPLLSLRISSGSRNTKHRIMKFLGQGRSQGEILFGIDLWGMS